MAPPVPMHMSGRMVYPVHTYLTRAPLHSDADGVQNWPNCIARKLMEIE